MTLKGSYLITGGTGSFGNAFVRYLLTQHNPLKVVVYSRDELKQAEMAERFKGDVRIRFRLGDVRDEDRMRDAFRDVDHVIHAAALKRVDSIANNPDEAFKTNAWGTSNVLRAARDVGVEKVLLISSDKAVQPTNHYGTSKAMAEHLTIGANTYGSPKGTLSSVVRYGNVLGSRGSVVHLFRDCAERGEPIPITHPLMTRFWLTLAGACELVRYALEDMQGGEIYVPKLQAMRITTLAEAIAAGHPTTCVGLRAGGEKLHEWLLSEEEVNRTYDMGDVLMVKPYPHPWRSYWRGEGKLIPMGTKYASDTTEHLDVAALRKLLEGVV